MRAHTGVKSDGKKKQKNIFFWFCHFKIIFFFWSIAVEDYREESFTEAKREDLKPAPSKEDKLFFVQQGREAMRKALSMLEDEEG